MQKSNIIMLACLVGLTCSCINVRAPLNTVPRRKAIATDAFGGWIMINPGNPGVRSGELIGLTEESVYIMTSVGLEELAKQDVVSARLIMFNTESSEYSVWTLAGSLATFSNGYFLIFTLPLWMVTGIPVTVGEAQRQNYIDYPASGWGELNKFARFPQGILPGIDLSSLRPRL